MSLQDRIINVFTDSLQTQQEVLAGQCEQIEYASQRLVSTLLNDRKILVCGNGRFAAGSALFASSLLNQFERERPSLPVVALNADAVTLTAIASEHHFDDVYAKQLRALGQSGDTLLVYTDGRRSTNIAKAISAAHDKDILVIALTGNDGGKTAATLNETDIEIRIPSSSSAHILEVQVLITHCLCDLIDHSLFGG